MNPFTAVIRTVSVTTHEVPLASESATLARQAADRAVDDLRSSHQDATLVRLDGPRGEVLFSNSTAVLDAGEVEVTWTVRMKAGSALEAACFARVAMSDPITPLAVYQVRHANGHVETVDLERNGPLH
jgi:hypothetical protein